VSNTIALRSSMTPSTLTSTGYTPVVAGVTVSLYVPSPRSVTAVAVPRGTEVVSDLPAVGVPSTVTVTITSNGSTPPCGRRCIVIAIAVTGT